jgi:hypothetical protein
MGQILTFAARRHAVEMMAPNNDYNPENWGCRAAGAPMFRRLFALLTVGLVSLAASAMTPATTEDTTWLVGVWALHSDPDGVKKDWVEFRADGTFISTNAACSTVTGRFRIHEGQVEKAIRAAASAVVQRMRPTADRNELRHTSSRTGNVSIYRRGSGTECSEALPDTSCGPGYPSHFPCLAGGQLLAAPTGELLPGVYLAAMLGYPESAESLSRRFTEVAVDSGWTHVGTWEGDEPEGKRYRSQFKRSGEMVSISVYPDPKGAVMQVMTFGDRVAPE